MIILGISYLSDAGACILKNGKLISAINEERLNRVKLFYGIPEKSIKYVLGAAGLTMKDIDLIVTHGFCKNERGIEFIDHGLIAEEGAREKAFEDAKEKVRNSKLDAGLKTTKIKEIDERHKHENFVIYERNIELIRKFRKFGKPIKVVEHHIAHAAAAYFSSGWNECYVLTADGWGEMESNIFCHAQDGKIKKLYYSHSFDSLGYFYGSVTKALGFIPHRHEGKVLGLAAAGNADKALSWMKGMISYNRREKKFEGGFANGLYQARFENPRLEALVKKYKREDIAAAVQRVLEKVVLDYVDDIVPKNARLAVAGGIFANVLLNQKLLEHPKIKDLFVYPQMGDGGLSAGSALYYYSRVKKLRPTPLNHLYFGPEYSQEEITREIRKFGYQPVFYKHIAKKVAKLLHENNCVMRFAGRMEYGPRALGNRSILFPAVDRTVNDWLNNALRRSEFMPFAPVTLKEAAEKCYKNIRNNWKRALHMTMTFNCTDWMKKASPGVVHIDGTARPQLIERKTNPSYYAILKHYEKLSGLPTLINTSFNMHEEPIVCTPNDALRAFQDSRLKYLAIGNYLVTNDKEDILFSPDK